MKRSFFCTPGEFPRCSRMPTPSGPADAGPYRDAMVYFFNHLMAAPRSSLVLQRRARQLRDRSERRLGRIQTEAEVLVVVGREHVGRLMPLRVPPGADLGAAFVLAQADRWNQILERSRVGIGHVIADGSRIFGRVLLVG